MRRLVLLALLALSVRGIGRPPELSFVKHTLDLGANEACAFTDVNKDGKLDIISGENWFEAPQWTPHRFRELNYTNNYVDDFSDLPMDVNGDGHVDVVSAAWFSKSLFWHENPGRTGGNWREHSIHSGVSNEFAFLVDLDNDGQARELLPQFGDAKAPLSWFEWRGGKWVRHQVSDKSYGHGIGAGDVNGDRRTDIVTPKGWFEAPADPRTGTWTFHGGFPEAPGLSFLHVADVNGDKRADIVGSHAHDYGLFWMEQGTDDTWTKRIIDDSWSGGHAVTLADLNRDGQLDLITGKRYMAHNGKDPGEREPLGVYWYEWRRAADGKVEWVRHVVEYGTRTGGGMQIPVADLDGDGDLDFATAGKSGLFLFENRTGGPQQSRR